MTRLDDSTLVAFVDGALDAAASHDVAQSLEHDPEAREKVRLLRLSATFVRAAFREPAYLQVSPELTKMIEGRPQVVGGPTRSTARRFAVPLVASIAAAVVLGFGGGFATRGTQPPNPRDFGEHLIDEVADYHVVYAREDEHLVEVPAERRDHIEAWLGDRLQRQLHVPDLSAHDLIFRGARLLVVDDRPVGELVYSRPDRPHRPVALCITFGGPGEEALRTEARDGITLALWRRQGYYYVLAGWMDKTALGRLAAELTPELDGG